MARRGEAGHGQVRSGKSRVAMRGEEQRMARTGSAVLGSARLGTWTGAARTG